MGRMICALLVAGLCFGLVSTASAEKKEKKEAVAEGVVKSVDAEKGTLVLTVGEKDVDVKTTEKTKISCNGKECKLADLKAGAKAKVSHTEGTASKIEAKVEAKKDGGDKK